MQNFILGVLEVIFNREIHTHQPSSTRFDSNDEILIPIQARSVHPTQLELFVYQRNIHLLTMGFSSEYVSTLPILTCTSSILDDTHLSCLGSNIAQCSPFVKNWLTSNQLDKL